VSKGSPRLGDVANDPSTGLARHIPTTIPGKVEGRPLYCRTSGVSLTRVNVVGLSNAGEYPSNATQATHEAVAIFLGPALRQSVDTGSLPLSYASIYVYKSLGCTSSAASSLLLRRIPIKMKVFALTSLALLLPANALLRFPCAQLVIDRLDPLVTPGQAPSPHLHQILGGVSMHNTSGCERYADFTELLQYYHGPEEGHAQRVHMHLLSV
jgi:hypothetical protein